MRTFQPTHSRSHGFESPAAIREASTADVLVFTFHPLYPAYRGAYGLSAHTDQQLAGVAMMVEQLVTLGTLVFLLLRPRLRHARVATV